MDQCPVGAKSGCRAIEYDLVLHENEMSVSEIGQIIQVLVDDDRRDSGFNAVVEGARLAGKRPWQ